MAIMSIYTTLRTSVESHLTTALSSLERLRHEPARTLDPITDPIDDSTMGRLVDGVVDDLQCLIAENERGQDQDRLRRRNELVRQALERTLEERLHNTAWSRVDSEVGSPALQFDLLDLMQTFSERGHTDVVSPLNAISALLDMQTISQCESTWLYIESRSKRLTKDMVPGKGKGLIILRMLNELLRRLPRSKQEHVIFSGRILVFLSSVFPLSEKSGVNLRGNFNTGKKTVYDEESGRRVEEEEKEKEKEKEKEGGQEVNTEKEKEREKAKKNQEKEKGTKEQAKEGERSTPLQTCDDHACTHSLCVTYCSTDTVDSFYPIFWSLQRVFTDPIALVASPPPVRGPDALDTLRLQLSKTLDMFAFETKKEKDLAGAATDPCKVGKPLASALASDVVDEEALGEYFFPRFLTSRNLLKLELADPTFRRQILVQFLVLFQYLISLTPPERIRTLSHGVTNTLVYGPHEVAAKHEKWLRELRERSVRELDAMQHGRRFRDAIEVMLKREQHWVNWKLQSCKPFELSPLPIEEVSQTARSKLITLSRKPKNYPYKLGNPVLSRLWERNLSTLEGYEPDLPRDDFNSLMIEWQMCDKVIKAKKALIEAETTEKAKKDELRGEIEQHELRLSSLHWRATRAASLQHLNLFNKIKAGDLDLLVKAIDDANRAPEEPASPEKTAEGEEKAKEETDGKKEMEGVEVEKTVAGEEVEMGQARGTTTGEDPPLEDGAWSPKTSRIVLIETDDEKSVQGSPKRSIAEAEIEGADDGSASVAKRAKMDDEA